MDDFLDPQRNARAASARIAQALDDADLLEKLHQLEKAHYRIERAQAAYAAEALAAGHDWHAIADAVQMPTRQARRRLDRRGS